MTEPRRVRRLVLAGIGGMLAVALAGCSSDSTDDDTSTASSPSQSASATETPAAVCEDVDTAKASLDALVATEILQEGTDTLKDRFATFKSDVQTLVDSGMAELAAQSAAVTASIAALDEVLAGLREDPTAADAALVKPALLAVKTSTEELVAAVGSIC